jgi:hypothetical protein
MSPTTRILMSSVSLAQESMAALALSTKMAVQELLCQDADVVDIDGDLHWYLGEFVFLE